jgi:hypothetical protein
LVVQRRLLLQLRKLDPEMLISTRVLSRLTPRGSRFIHIPGIFIHIPGIRIHILPESLFTSLRNPYSHRPEYATNVADLSYSSITIPQWTFSVLGLFVCSPQLRFFSIRLQSVDGFRPSQFDVLNHLVGKKLRVEALSSRCAFISTKAAKIIHEYALAKASGAAKLQNLLAPRIPQRINGWKITIFR